MSGPQTPHRRRTPCCEIEAFRYLADHEITDPVATFLASPEAAEGLARAMEAAEDATMAAGSYVGLDLRMSDLALAVLAAWQQERAKIGD